MSAASHRMQRYRNRKKAGACLVVRLAVTDAQVLDLIDSGYLQAWDDQDAAKIADAVQRAWDDVTGSAKDVC